MWSLPAPCGLPVGLSLWVATSPNTSGLERNGSGPSWGQPGANLGQLEVDFAPLYEKISPFMPKNEKSASRPLREPHFCKSSHCIWGPKLTFPALQSCPQEPFRPPFSSPTAPWYHRVAFCSRHEPFKHRIIARDLCTCIVPGCTWTDLGPTKGPMEPTWSRSRAIWSQHEADHAPLFENIYLFIN